jgi:putative ABC transport system substrate-binding protein
MIRRRALVRGGLGLGAATLLPGSLRAQQFQHSSGRPFKIAMILWRGWEEASQGFKDYLDERRIACELFIRDAGQDVSKLPAIIAEVKRLKPDLVYLWGTTTALEVLGPVDQPDPVRHILDIPVVFNIVTEPLAGGLIRAHEQSGRNATGTLYIAPIDIQMRSWRAYRRASSIGVVFNPLERNSIVSIKLLKEEGERSGFSVVELPVPVEPGRGPRPDALPELVARLAGEASWMYIPPDTFLNTHRKVLMDSALANKLPSFSSSEAYLRAGALVGLVSRYYSVGRFTALKAAQILVEGQSAGDIPVEPLSRFSLMVNMQVARQLQVYPPLSMLRYAEIV